MPERRNLDRRTKQKRFYGIDRRAAPRRLTCECGGLVKLEFKAGRGREWVLFTCGRCKKKETRYLGPTKK